jgi:hypothetical protein
LPISNFERREHERKTLVTAATVVFTLALTARLLPVFIYPSLNYPDEIFQSVEQAHRLVYGNGLVPWEFVYGTRSWFLPGVIAGLMEFARLFGAGPAYYLPIVGVALATLGASSALCAFLWGHRFYGYWGGILAGVFTAMWIDLAYFGPRPLSEVVAAHVLVIGLYLMAPGYVVSNWRRLASAGFLLGLAAMLRIQLAPAVALIVLWPAEGWRRNLAPLALGGFAVFLLFGALDWATWSYPWESLYRNLALNLYYGISGQWGVEPWYFYAGVIITYWTPIFAAAVLVLAYFGAYREKRIVLAALAVFVVHSLVGHKEFRFIYPAILLTAISAGIGLAYLIDRLSRQSKPFILALPAMVVVVLTSVVLLKTENYRELWTRDAAVMRASVSVSQLPDVCGIELYGIPWFWSGGYWLMHQKVPLYWFEGEKDFAAHQDAFNTLVAAGEVPAPFEKKTCFGTVCLAQRPGSCAPLPMQQSIDQADIPSGLTPELKP